MSVNIVDTLTRMEDVHTKIDSDNDLHLVLTRHPFIACMIGEILFFDHDGELCIFRLRGSRFIKGLLMRDIQP